MKRQSEAREQTNLITWSQLPSTLKKYPEFALLYHVPNGGSRNVVEAKHLKEQGVKRGVPDLFLPVARGNFHGLYIEMKSEKGRLTKEQKWWKERILEQGYFWQLCRDWKSAAQVITRYLRQN